MVCVEAIHPEQEEEEDEEEPSHRHLLPPIISFGQVSMYREDEN